MTFEGRSAEQALNQFKDHVNHLLATTVTQRPLVAVPFAGGRERTLSFWEAGEMTTAPLRTRVGVVHLLVGYVCSGVPDQHGRFAARVHQYRFHLRHDQANESCIRWEFVRSLADPGARWSRSHVQGPVRVPFGAREHLFLNDIHLPTGWAPIEEVIRFCIVDLGVVPLSDDWDARLRESRRMTRVLQPD